MTDAVSDRIGGWIYRPEHDAPVEPLSFGVPYPLPGRGPSPTIEMVFLDDGAYIPAVVQRPKGSGPFPIIVFVHGGSGGLGLGYLSDHLVNRGWLTDAFVAAGYAIAYAEGRREIEDGYDTGLPCPLDHDDMVRVVTYLAAMPDIDGHRVGWVGTSHGGELGAKVACEAGDTVRAYALCEPAAIEFLGLEHRAGTQDLPELPTLDDSSSMRSEEHLDFDREVGDDEIDVDVTLARIARIDRNVSFLVYGRDGDHLQGVFRKVHEMLERGGCKTQWISSEHPEHVFHWGPRRSAEGYVPDQLHVLARDELLGFFDTALG